MSLYDYKMGRHIEGKEYPFYAIIQAAMRQADTDNLEKLKSVFPEVWNELSSRYKAPCGILPGEKDE